MALKSLFLVLVGLFIGLFISSYIDDSQKLDLQFRKLGLNHQPVLSRSASQNLQQEESDLEAQTDAEWRIKNSCKSREELPNLYHSRHKSLPVNQKWNKALRDYSRHHKYCMQKIGDPTNYFISRNTSVPECKFLVPFGRNGLGNRVLLYISSILYAILTKRVILIPEDSVVPQIFCEPFVGSTWKLSENFPLPEAIDLPQKHQTPETRGLWMSSKRAFELLDTAVEKKGFISDVYAAEMSDDWEPYNRFYCNTEQDQLEHVDWIFLSGCLYFLPRLFSIPIFRPILEDWFPDKMVLTHMLRTLMLPSDHVWSNFQHVQHVHGLGPNTSILGFQIRYRDGAAAYNQLNRLINSRVLICALQNGLLPRAPRSKDLNSTKIFIASLFPGLRSELAQYYDESSIIQLTEDKVQASGQEEKALVEILTLSISDNLLITPMSTFGGLAQAYGGITPWFINFKGDNGVACLKAQSVDNCYQIAVQTDMDKYSCPHDPLHHGKAVHDVVPYIQKCMEIDSKGIQLMNLPVDA